ncbi:FecCD family ABC transporter permease [Pseudoalteromonas denitrificans]|uniref:Vitamin B12 transport system permease protein n=1 Tax=Pseudoalteromonas denitrificans DSM 6059 TaxID=1123010 RepID=A0A1I1GPH2_9GAMM|nr:iron ABC transporter permease [Pseudoalteromonas denitrificans]SFC13355.1 vitamin B12 transport system permease protein [Pseudoalteromonas denitrificans DSM 6059]
MKSVKKKLYITILTLLILFIISLFYGGISSHTISPINISDINKVILYDLRLPKILTAILVGTCLALSGHLFQLLLSNPLAEPGLLGVSSLASLFVMLGAAIFNYINIRYDVFFLVLSSSLGALLAVTIIFQLAKRLGQYSSASLILSGISLTTLISAISSWLIYYSDNTQLRTFNLWLLGSFEHVTFFQLMFIGLITVTVTILCMCKSKELNMLYMGDQNATLYGLKVNKLRKYMLILASTLAACAVALGGVIAFIGLLAPHATRIIFGHDNRLVLPMLVINGASFMVFIEWISRTSMSLQLPLGLVTATLGGPFFLFILFKHFKNQGL